MGLGLRRAVGAGVRDPEPHVIERTLVAQGLKRKRPSPEAPSTGDLGGAGTGENQQME